MKTMETLKLKGQQFFSKGASKDILMALLAALLSVLIFACGLSYATSEFDPENTRNSLSMRHSEFDMSIFEGIERDCRDIDTLKAHIENGSSINDPDFARDVLFFHIDILFFIGLLTGAKNILPLLLAAYYIKYGLLAAFTYLLLRIRINLSKSGSLLLSVAFAVSFVALRTSLNTSMFNALVLMPLVLLLLLTYAWNGGRKLFIFSTVACFCFCLTGIYATILLLPLLLISAVILTVGTLHKNIKTYLRLVSSCLLAFGMAAFIFIPAVFGNRFSENFIESFKTGVVNFKLFDSIYSFMDGNIEGASIMTHLPSLGLSVFVLVLVVLFFVNRVIPFRFKLCSGLFLLITYISIAYTGLGNIFLFEGAQESFYYARLISMAMYFIFIAGISLRNINTIKNGEIYIPAFGIIAYLILSNSSSSEITHGTVSLYFSAFAVIICCSLIYTLINNIKSTSFFLVLLVLSGITFNNAFCFAPSSFPAHEIIPKTYFDNVSSDEDDYIFEAGKTQYIVAASDISEIYLTGAPHQNVNTVAALAMLNPVYVNVSNSLIYYSGATDLGFNAFEITPGTPMVTVNYRIYKEHADDPCFISSSYEGKCHLRVLYDEEEYDYEFDGPFLWQVEFEKDSFVVAMDFEGSMYGTFQVMPLTIDMEAQEEFNNALGEVRRNEINLSLSSYMKYDGVKSVITSLKYSSDYEVIYTKDNLIVEAECFDFNGYLAFKVESGGLEHQQAKILNSKEDFIIGTIISVIMIISFILLSFMYNKKRLVKQNEAKTLDINLGENEVDKRED